MCVSSDVRFSSIIRSVPQTALLCFLGEGMAPVTFFTNLENDDLRGVTSKASVPTAMASMLMPGTGPGLDETSRSAGSSNATSLEVTVDCVLVSDGDTSETTLFAESCVATHSGAEGSSSVSGAESSLTTMFLFFGDPFTLIATTTAATQATPIRTRNIILRSVYVLKAANQRV